MSNKSPIESSPCGVCVGWVSCKAKAALCWAQNKLEFLCERDMNAPLDLQEQRTLANDWMRFHEERRKDVISERCMKADYTSRAAFKDWTDCAIAHGFTPSSGTVTALKGKLTFLNRIGLLPTTGLTCMCCAGYRVWGAALLGLAVGLIL